MDKGIGKTEKHRCISYTDIDKYKNNFREEKKDT